MPSTDEITSPAESLPSAGLPGSTWVTIAPDAAGATTTPTPSTVAAPSGRSSIATGSASGAATVEAQVVPKPVFTTVIDAGPAATAGMSQRPLLSENAVRAPIVTCAPAMGWRLASTTPRTGTGAASATVIVRTAPSSTTTRGTRVAPAASVATVRS